ncbi:MAG: translation elongation factor Ts [Chlamydiales bacterium]
MSQITPQMVKTLRERTGAGMGKCKKALEEANGDIEAAIAHLRKAGIASAVKKEGRETKEGTIKTAENQSLIALIEVSAETDFVVRNDQFQEFANTLAQEVCDTLPSDLEAFLQQSFSKNPGVTVDEYRLTIIHNLGENIQVRRIFHHPKKPNTSIGVYSHAGGNLVTLVELSGSSDETVLAKDIAMHVAAESPSYLSREEIPESEIAHEKEIARAQVQNKPDHIIDKILEGKIKAYCNQVCLLNQHFVKNPDITIEELVEKRGKEIGKPLKITQFVRWKVGE